MIRFSDDHSWDDLLPRLRKAISRGAFRDLAEAQRAFDLAPDEPLEGDLAGNCLSEFGVVSLTEIDGEIASGAVHPFASAPLASAPLTASGVPFSGTSISGLPRARTLRTELLERRDALSAMPVVSYAATATAWQATVFQASGFQASVWQASVAGQAPVALVSTPEDWGQTYDRPAARSSLRVVGSRVVGKQGPRRAALAVHDCALAELLADRAVTCPSECLEYAVA